MNFKKEQNLSLWSNIFFLFPLTIIIINYDNFSLLFFIITLSTLLFSSIYHSHFKEKDMAHTWKEWFKPERKKISFLRFFDWISAFILIYLAVNLILNLTYFNSYFYLSITSFVIGFFFFFYKWREEYDFYHALWHIGTATSFGFLLIASL